MPAIQTYSLIVVINIQILLPPATKFREGNAFTPVSHSVHGGGLCKGGSLSRGVSVRETSCTVMRWPYASYRNPFLFSFNFNLWQKNIELSVRFYLKNKIFTSFPGPHSGEAQTYKSRPLSQPSQTTTPLSLTSVRELVVVQTMFSIRGSLTKTCAPKTFELPNCEIMNTMLQIHIVGWLVYLKWIAYV